MSQNYIGNEWEQILLNQKRELAKAENQLKQEIENQKLKDQFAGQALQGLLAGSWSRFVDGKKITPEISEYAEQAYKHANEMMKARTK